MKKNIIKIISLFSVLLLWNCSDDELSLQPYDQVKTEDYYKTEDDFTFALKGVYSTFMEDGYFGADGSSSDWIITGDLTTDNLILNPQGRLGNLSSSQWDYNPSNNVSGLYTSGYAIISRANLILANVDNLEDGAFKDNVIGEARAVRGLVHFDLARTFSKIPTQSADANSFIGIAYIDTFDPFASPVRDASVSLTYSKIVEDLETAVSLINSNNGSGHLSKAAVYALLSRVYLYMGDNLKAAANANLAISNGATVASRANFEKVWNDSSSEGVLFKIEITSADDIDIGVNYGQANKAEYVCDYGLYQLYKDTDIRKSAYIRTANFQGNQYNVIKKYEMGQYTANVTDGKLIRSAEVYLNLAEALYPTNQAEALAALDEVRSNRYENFVSGNETGQALWDAIQLERRLELAFEGDRFYTLKRLGLPVQRSGFGEFADGTGAAASAQLLPASSHKWQWPISTSVRQIDTEIEQTPGY